MNQQLSKVTTLNQDSTAGGAEWGATSGLTVFSLSAPIGYWILNIED